MNWSVQWPLVRDYLIGRLSDKTVWLGMMGVLASLGAVIVPELRDPIATFGAAGMGILGIIVGVKRTA